MLSKAGGILLACRVRSYNAPIHRARGTFPRIKQPSRSALMAGLVRIEPFDALLVICPRPAPGVHWTAQGQPEQLQPLHSHLVSANHLVANYTATARSCTQNFLADLCVDWKKLCSRHAEPSMCWVQTQRVCIK